MGSSEPWANVLDQFSVNPNPILAGSQATLDLQLTLSADSGYFNAAFNGGTATLYDGLGDSQTFNIGVGGTFRDFSAAFTYPNAGGYSPNYSVSVNYTEDAQVQVGTGSYQVQTGTYCAFYNIFGSCLQYVPIYTTYYYPIYQTETFAFYTGTFGSSPLTVNPVVVGSDATTPLPAALPLFATGLGAFGLFGWRRKRKGAAEAAA
jgi:hypothetical protein